MDSLVIHGAGPLHGEVTVSGAKNAALPLLAATLLAPGEHLLRNVPELTDVRTLLRLLTGMGCETRRGRGAQRTTLRITVPKAVSPEAPYELVKTMRASVLVLGPLLARHGSARVSLPGGCAIGARPIDQHLKALTALGAQIELVDGYVHASTKGLKGTTVTFDMITVTGTENIMMAAALAKGRTVIKNAAREPEIENLAQALNRMGAQVSGAGTAVITIDGVSSLAPAEQEIIPDRIEAGTLLVAAAITGGETLVRKANPAHLEPVLHKLREAGASIRIQPDGISLRGPNRPTPVEIATQEHPGFPTDMQAQLMALLTVASGSSVISENIFENRYMHVAELARMGAKITVKGRTAVIHGVDHLLGAQVMATDLRASASLLLAALAARGRTVISRVYHLDRGYERLDRKLRSLGASIRRVKGRSS